MRRSRLRRLKIRYETAGEDEDLNITALIDIFTMLLFFLLTAAAFTKTAILELNLPTEESDSSVHVSAAKESFSLTLAITKNGFFLKDYAGKNINIPLKNRDYDYDLLSQELKKLKDLSPEQRSIVFLLESEIVYDVIIKTMDRARELIIKKDHAVKRYLLFPEISLADSIVLQ